MEQRAGSSKNTRKFMRRNLYGLTLCAMLVTLCSSAAAQQPKQVPRIGFLVPASLSSVSARTEAFRQKLRDLGYIEGQNVAIEWRSAEGKFDAPFPRSGERSRPS